MNIRYPIYEGVYRILTFHYAFLSFLYKGYESKAKGGDRNLMV